MTIRLLRPFNGLPSNGIVELDRGTEAALVSTLAATTNLAGGFVVNAPEKFTGAPVSAKSTSAEDFGASSNASAEDNQKAIQDALNNGGDVSLTTPGTYQLASDSFTFPSGQTSFRVGAGVVFEINGTPAAPLTLFNNEFDTGPVKGFGYRTVLFGDSMTSRFQTDLVTTTATYNAETGVFTAPLTLHGLATGWPVSLYNGNVPGLATQLRVTALRADANTVQFQLPARLPIPASITSNTFVRVDYFESANGWVKWLNTLSGNRFNVVFNGAQSGDVSGNALRRIHVNCLNFAPQVVLMQLPGINDMGNNVPEETIWSNQQAIMRLITERAICVCLTVTPVRSGEVRATLQNMQRVMRLRERLLEYARTNPRLVVVDSYRLVVDPTNATGLASSTNGYILGAPDNIHYSPTGAYNVGLQVWNTISPMFRGTADHLPASGFDSYGGSTVTLSSVSRTNNVVTATSTSHGFLNGEVVKIVGGSSEVFNDVVTLRDVTVNTVSWDSVGTAGAITGAPTMGRNPNIFAVPLLLTATGGTVSAPVTGTAAAGVRVSTTGTITSAVASVVANVAGFGNNQQVVVTPGATGATCGIQTELTNTLLPLMRAGRSYFFECEVVLSGVAASNITELRHRVFGTTDAVDYEVKSLTATDNVAAGFADGTYNLRTPTFRLQSGNITSIFWQVQARFSASSASALTMSVGRIRMIEVEML